MLNDTSVASAGSYIRTCRRIRNSKKIATIRDFHQNICVNPTNWIYHYNKSVWWAGQQSFVFSGVPQIKQKRNKRSKSQPYLCVISTQSWKLTVPVAFSVNSTDISCSPDLSVKYNESRKLIFYMWAHYTKTLQSKNDNYGGTAQNSKYI